MLGRPFVDLDASPIVERGSLEVPLFAQDTGPFVVVVGLFGRSVMGGVCEGLLEISLGLFEVVEQPVATRRTRQQFPAKAGIAGG